MSVLILYAIPAFVVLMLVEALWARHAAAENAPDAPDAPDAPNAPARLRGYARSDTSTSIAMGLGNVLVTAVTKAASFAILVWLHQYRMFDLGTGALAWVLLFFAEDFFYYWYHRTHHEVRLFWAGHVNHHSSQHYNLSTALRQSWITPFTSPVFWWPLALLGFEPWMILTQQAISLLYQFSLHTEAVGKLGPLEWFFNTPSHHRVHHGSNVEYLDRNHGGILIIWDRLFSTFAPERTPVDYGLTKNLTTHHLVRVAFHEWRAMLHDAWHARSLGDALRYVFGAPGWAPGDAAETSEALQARRRAAS